MLTATKLSKSYGPQILFEEASLQLDAGKRYGIVGANGSGKSTLLRILTGEEQASSGQVSRQKRARMGVLQQDHFAWEDTSILEVVMRGHAELWEAMEEKERLLERAHEYFDEDRYVQLEDIVTRFDGYTLESRAAQILEGLNIPTEQHKQPLRVLSGGYKLRALLGQTLASQPDLLLLDEPTNHLDILSIQWLEGFLQQFRGCAAVISHDQRFLDQVCTHILDVDYQRVTLYKGNYSRFVQQKRDHRARMEAEIQKREKEIADHRAFISRFKAKATKARQANSRAKRLDKIEIESLPSSSRRHPRFHFRVRRPSGKEVLAIQGVSKAFGDKEVLKGVQFSVDRGDRLAILGPNGIGKSTLLKILMGEQEADEGSFRWGYEADPGYFPQNHHEAMGDLRQSLTSFIWDSRPESEIGFVYGKLAEALFSREDADKKLSALSGGEAARALFSRLGVQKNTVLVLDEPTNHLDMEGIESLAQGLKDYDGTLIFVSHDRWFVEEVATRIIEITPEGVLDFRGSYAEHLARQGADHLDLEAVAAAERRAKRERKRKKKGSATATKTRQSARAPERSAAAPETALSPEQKPAEQQAPEQAAPRVLRRKAGDQGRRGRGRGRRRR